MSYMIWFGWMTSNLVWFIHHRVCNRETSQYISPRALKSCITQKSYLGMFSSLDLPTTGFRSQHNLDPRNRLDIYIVHQARLKRLPKYQYKIYFSERKGSVVDSNFERPKKLCSDIFDTSTKCVFLYFDIFKENLRKDSAFFRPRIPLRFNRQIARFLLRGINGWKYVTKYFSLTWLQLPSSDPCLWHLHSKHPFPLAKL